MSFQLRSPTPAKHYVPKAIKHEQNLQLRVCRYLKRNYPHVPFVADYAAGMKMTRNQRMIMMSMRSDEGQPDLSIDFASRGFHGLRIELKKEGVVLYNKDGSLRKSPYKRIYRANGKNFVKRGDHLAEQAAMLKKLRNGGFYADFSIGYDATIKLLDWYMCKPENQTIF